MWLQAAGLSTILRCMHMIIECMHACMQGGAGPRARQEDKQQESAEAPLERSGHGMSGVWLCQSSAGYHAAPCLKTISPCFNQLGVYIYIYIYIYICAC